LRNRSGARPGGDPGCGARPIGDRPALLAGDRPALLPRRELLALAGITVLAAVLRFATLDVQSFWFDEAATVGVLDRSFGGMLDAIPRGESTPPLYYVLAWLWSRPFGLGEVGLRSLSALLGTLTVPVAFAAARELCGSRVGLWVAALAAVSPFLVWYSQEARSYALLVLLGALAVWLFARLLREGGARNAALWALVAALALATHYFALFLIAPMALWLLLHAPRRLAVPAVGAVGLAGVALLPIALDQQRAELAGFIDDGSLAVRAAQVVKQLALGFDSPVEPLTAAIAVAIVAAGVGLALRLARDRAGIRIAVALGAAAIVLPVLLALVGTDYVLTRNVILAWLPLAIVVVAGLTALGRTQRAGTAALGVLAALGLTSTVGVPLVGEWQREDWRAAASAIGPPAARAILVTEPSQAVPVALYREGASPPALDPIVVDELVALARRDDDADRALAPSPDVLASLGLRIAERRVEPTYELLRLVPQAGQVTLSAGQVLTLGLDMPERPSALLTEGGAGEPPPPAAPGGP
jgi:4-amino-4-deoxy-L-arabinose transferase-like glycosyltransferase